MNKALLARLGWRLINEEDSLWNRMLLAKYGRGRDGLNVFEPKQCASHVYRGIVSSAHVLNGAKWKVANGRKNEVQGICLGGGFTLEVYSMKSSARRSSKKKVREYDQ